MQLVNVHPRDIDIDGEWLFWAEEPDEALSKSLESIGQTTPALADFSSGRPRLVAGYRRALALRGIKGSVLSTLAVDFSTRPETAELSDTSDELRFGLLYLASNMGRAVTDPMMVRALRFFSKHVSAKQSLRLAGPYMGLSPKSRQAKHLLQWLSLPPEFDALLTSGNLALASAPDLSRLGDAGRRALLPCLSAVRWSRNNLRNLAAWVAETAVCNDMDVPGAVEQMGLDALLERNLSPNDTIAGLLGAARLARYPHLFGMEERFLELSKALSKGTPYKVRASPGFESDAVTLSVRVGKTDDLDAAARGLETMAGREQWEAVWSLAKGGEK